MRCRKTMAIPCDQPVGDRAGKPHRRQVQEAPDRPPGSSTVTQSARNAAAATVGVTALNQIGRRLHILDRQTEPCEIIERLEWQEPNGRPHATLQPCGPLSAEPTVAVKDEEASDPTGSGLLIPGRLGARCHASSVKTGPRNCRSGQPLDTDPVIVGLRATCV